MDIIDEDIQITKNENLNIGTLCLNCDDITRFSDEDDDFVPNYDITYRLEFLMMGYEIDLCENCLRKLKGKIDKVLIE